MKKLLSLIALVGIMAACNNKKADKDKPKDDTTATTTPTTENNTTATTSADIPKFADAEVQKFVEDYTAFVTAYVEAYKTKDAAKIQEWSAKSAEWSQKSPNIAMKLSANAEEAKKFSDYMTKLSQDMVAAMQMK